MAADVTKGYNDETVQAPSSHVAPPLRNWLLWSFAPLRGVVVFGAIGGGVTSLLDLHYHCAGDGGRPPKRIVGAAGKVRLEQTSWVEYIS